MNDHIAPISRRLYMRLSQLAPQRDPRAMALSAYKTGSPLLRAGPVGVRAGWVLGLVQGPGRGSQIPKVLCCACPSSLSQTSYLLARTLQLAAGAGPHRGPYHHPRCLLRAQGLNRPFFLRFPPLLSLAQRGLCHHGLLSTAVTLLPSPFSVSHGVATQALFRKHPRCSHIQPSQVCAPRGSRVSRE